ncbi:MAG: hypothetical protein HYW57_02855 [Ignavibacteriales bacterium]|nr:hypothetical protein [Ignavibacteriales bacterium]
MKRAVLMMVLIAQSGLSQSVPRIGEWKNFTDKKNVRSVAAFGGQVWAATSGGLFVLENGNTIVAQYTNSEGLSNNDATAVAVDGSGSIWIGYQDGSINARDEAESAWRAIRDIKESNRIQKRIRKLQFVGDSLFVATDFGISVYRLSRSEFGDTYANFGFVSQAGVNEVLVWRDEIWAATDLGLARAPRFATNLSAPTSWTRYQTTTSVTSLMVFNDTLVVGTSAGAAYFDGAGLQPIASLAARQVVGMSVKGSEFLVASNLGGVITLQMSSDVTGTATTVATESSTMATDFATTAAGVLWIGTTSRGMALWDGSTWEFAAPNGPESNLFSSIVVDGDGVLWCASGISGQGRGFYRYTPSLPDQSRWKNFTIAEYPLMESNDYFKIALGTDGTVWASSWGSGVVQARGDSVLRKLDTGTTPSLATSDAMNPAFPVINGVAVDGQGKTWFVNWGAKNRNFLARLTSDTSFAYFTTALVSQGFFTAVAIDEYGTKWLANAEPFHPAKGLYLYYLNEDALVSGTSSTSGWGFMTESDGLPNNTVFSVAVDLTGSVCVGTALGLMIISDPLFPKQRRFSSFPLREQSVQAIAVDAVNNKWVGTKEGVFVMNPDATQILGQYTVSNTGGRLVDNDIRSLAIDQERGIIYIGTEKGLSSLAIAPVSVSRTLSTLTIGPNPYIIPTDRQLEIRNLTAEATIKILTVNGFLVSEFGAQGGGRAFWNGRDREGNLVGSGVYFVVAFGNNGDEVASTKVAVIRK